MEKREQHMLARLEEARQIQARAMQRFALIQERLVRLEARLQATHERLATSSPDPYQSIAALPASGDLELIDHFGNQAADEDATERLTVLRARPQQSISQDVADEEKTRSEQTETLLIKDRQSDASGVQATDVVEHTSNQAALNENIALAEPDTLLQEANSLVDSETKPTSSETDVLTEVSQTVWEGKEYYGLAERSEEQE